MTSSGGGDGSSEVAPASGKCTASGGPEQTQERDCHDAGAHFALATRDTCPTRFFADTPVINLWSMLLFMRPASAFVNAEPLSAVFIQVLRRTFADFHIIQKRRTALNLLVPDKWQPARYTHI